MNPSRPSLALLFAAMLAGSAGPSAMRGNWSVAELEAVLAARKAK